MSSKKRQMSLVSKYLPITRWLQTYTKKKFVSDIIAGVTVGITMIPQSIAYAALANLTPQYGLYSAFVGCFVYSILGTIKEVFIGPSSLMAILAATYTHNLNIEFIIFLTFLSGCVEFIMGLLKLGFLVDFISVPVISGFVSAVAVIIFISQLKDLMGLQFKSGSMIQNIASLISNCDKIRYSDFLLGIICIAALYSLRHLKDIKIREKQKKEKNYLKTIIWFISISRNAIVVFFCMCLSAWFQFFYKKVPFVLTSDIDSGIPEFKMPPLSTHVGNVTYSFTEMVEEIGLGILVVPLVAILENIAIAKAFSKGKTIEATQEMFALSFSNILGACFGAMPTCGALTRSAVSNASNVQSPIASFYSGAVVLLAVTFLSPYFHFIPRATLAAVLICALIFLIEWEIVIPLWKTSKKDFFILMVTFFLSLIFGVEIGLLSGIAVSLLHLIYLWTCPKITSEIHSFTDNRKYILLTVDKGLYFPCMDRLRNIILQKKEELEDQTSAIVIDCTYFTGVDYTAIKELCLLISELNEQGQKLLLLKASHDLTELCHTIGKCKMLLNFSSKQEVEDYLICEDMKENPDVKVCISKEYNAAASDVKSSKEVLPLLEENSQQSKPV